MVGAVSHAVNVSLSSNSVICSSWYTEHLPVGVSWDGTGSSPKRGKSLNTEGRRIHGELDRVDHEGLCGDRGIPAGLIRRDDGRTLGVFNANKSGSIPCILQSVLKIALHAVFCICKVHSKCKYCNSYGLLQMICYRYYNTQKLYCMSNIIKEISIK